MVPRLPLQRAGGTALPRWMTPTTRCACVALANRYSGSENGRMSTLGLALDLRPKSLDEVVGQDEIKPAIRNFMDNQCITWLFAGPTGVGKTTLAHIVAREIQGWDYPKDSPVQVTEIDGHLSITQVRELIQQSYLSPIYGRYAVILLDEAQAITGAAQTALLGALENTHGRAAWILCTTDPTKLAKPLRDRCAARFTLTPMGSKERRELVARAAVSLNYKGEVTKLLEALDEAKVASAREVYGSFEQFSNGMPPRMAVGIE
jgi:DNA polymerase III gamma/tau subunit